jgi:3-hydroxyisobutyrate dehydrogenase
MNGTSSPQQTKKEAMRSVGVIGLGKMGLPIAVNLMEQGFAVVGYRRNPSTELAEAGGELASSPAAVAERVDVLLSILPDADALREVVLGEAGTLAALKPGTVHIEMSTIDVAEKAEINAAITARGGHMLDCPISGSPGMVLPRKATTFASGDSGQVEAVSDVLAAISGPWVNAGEFGAGTRLKYIANLLVAIHTVAAAEALALAERSGLDLAVVQDALDNSIAGSAILRQRGPVMRARSWTPAPGPIGTLHPILEQIEDYLPTVGLTTPVFAAAKHVFDTAIRDGGAELDIAAVFDEITGEKSGLAGVTR